MMRIACLSISLVTVSLLLASRTALAAPPEDSWSEQQVAKFPKSETPVHLFNGKDLTGWTGHINPYWSVEDEEIVAKNTAQNEPNVSTYCLTDKKNYHSFRLVLESKLVTGETHSGVALWGHQFNTGGEKFSYQGHLVMFPSGWGFFDLFGRNLIYKDKDGAAKKAGKQHDWNRIEILAIPPRIRLVVNGKLVADWSDPKPETCKPGPIGLQLHARNKAKVAKEVRFRGLILSENPEDHVITADEKQ